MESYREENSELIKSYLYRTFFRAMENCGSESDVFCGNYRSVELILTPSCDLNCTYCYFTKNKDKYFTPRSLKAKEIVDNIRAIINWFIENRYNPSLELFGGDPIFNGAAFYALDVILDGVKSGLKPPRIVIPTNGSFIDDDDKVIKLFRLKDSFKHYGVDLILSLSIDGYFLDNKNRPKKKGNRSKDFYRKIFEFAAEYKAGFHPMIYSENIDLWPENFLWFQAMFSKYSIAWDNIYLLEVRNPEWSVQQTIGLAKFVEFLIDWAFTKLGKDDYIGFITRGKGFNILSNPFSTLGRGIGCSIQSTIGIRTGDLTVFPCHRLMYKGMEAFRFIKDSDSIVDIEAINPELFITIQSIDHRSFPVCETCAFKELCSGGCLGAQYEVTGDPFTPIPTVCRMEQLKILAILSKYEELGILHDYMRILNYEKVYAINKIINGGLLDVYRKTIKSKEFPERRWIKALSARL